MSFITRSKVARPVYLTLLPAEIDSIFSQLVASLGPLPLVETEEHRRLALEAEGGTDDGAQREQALALEGGKKKVETNFHHRINADGTYATENALTFASPRAVSDDSLNLRKLLLKGNYAVAVAIGAALAKLSVSTESSPSTAKNLRRAQSMLVITCLLRLGLSSFVPFKIDKDSYDRLVLFLRILSKPTERLEEALAFECRYALENYLGTYDPTKSNRILYADSKACNIDDSLSFRFAKPIKFPSPVSTSASASASASAPALHEWSRDTEQAIGAADPTEEKLYCSLSKVVQLSGFSDKIYAETYVTFSHSDVLLDILLVNQMDETLQNVSIDLSTSGDLKVSEKSPPITLAPQGFAIAKAGLKIHSTNNGLIFGCISFGVTDVETIVISTITIDVCEYIHPTVTNEPDFRRTWTTLEWENKINVPPIPGSTLKDVVGEILKGSKLECITPGYGISQTGDYLAANLYAQSLFGEEILANVCLERSSEIISGHLRLRSKTQGIAIALGDRITELVSKISRSLAPTQQI